MGASRKGMRSITVGNRRYFWRAKGTDHGINVVVTTDEAFVSGQHGQWLFVTVPYYSMSAAHQDGWSLHQRAIVKPGVVRQFIERALTRQRPFTGRDGEPDITLTVDEVADVMKGPTGAFLAAELRRAGEVLVDVDPTNPNAKTRVEVLWGYFLSIGRLCETNHAPELSELVRGWFEEHGVALAQAVGAINGAVASLRDDVRKPTPEWQAAWERHCQRRSGLQCLLDLARAAGASVLDDVDTSLLDAAIAERAKREKPVKPWPGIPASHAWWEWAGRA
ncbi:MAG: hypothetical protein AB2A00_14340 [Myxococcota bacterium]